MLKSEAGKGAIAFLTISQISFMVKGGRDLAKNLGW